MSPPTEPAHQPVRSRSGVLPRAGRTLTGVLLLLIGAALLIFPGPGLPLITAGLAMLAIDYRWARRLLDRARARLAATRTRVPTRRRTTSATTGPDRSATHGAAQ
jgi:hypothetical protein